MKNIFLLFLPFIAFAHPHVFIDYSLYFIVEQEKIIGIRTEWYFDEIYSGNLIQNYDENNDGEFSDQEIKMMEKDAFSNLENYEYFTYISIDHERFKVKSVKDFSSAIQENRVVYTFFIPCQVAITSAFKEIVVCLYDETYYVDLFPLEDNSVFLSNDEGVDYEIKIFEDIKESRDYGEIYPYSIRLTFRKKI